MKKQPIFTKILIPLMGLVILEILILMVSIYGQGLFSLIHKNSQDIIESRVEARRNYLESLMVNQWMNVSQTVQKINLLADGLVDAGKMDIECSQYGLNQYDAYQSRYRRFHDIKCGQSGRKHEVQEIYG